MRVSQIWGYNPYKSKKHDSDGIGFKQNLQSELKSSTNFSVHNRNNITFTQQLPAIHRLDKRLTKPALRCIYCGIFTLPENLFRQAIKSAGIKKSSPASRIVSALDGFKETLHGSERRVFDLLEDESVKHPDIGASEILTEYLPVSKEKLVESQFEAFDRIDGLCKGLPPHLKREMRATTRNARWLLKRQNQPNPFSRRTFLEDLAQTRDHYGEPRLQSVYQEAHRLLYPKENENNFIVKFAREGALKIVQELFRPSFMTLDHIHPQSRGGATELKNLAWSCANCNGGKGSHLLDRWVEINPNIPIPKNCQRYVDNLHGLNFSPYEGYFYDLSETLYVESDGRIRIRIPEEMAKVYEESTPSVFGHNPFSVLAKVISV